MITFMIIVIVNSNNDDLLHQYFVEHKILHALQVDCSHDTPMKYINKIKKIADTNALVQGARRRAHVES